MPNHQLLLGDCLNRLKELPDNSIDAVVTDPPYGLTQNKKGGTGVKSINLNSPHGRARISTGNGAGGFMGQKWDSGVPTVEIWAECLRVLKPGGNLLSFAGTRTQHRMVANILGAGFELQDIVLWSYGSGFPKSLDISKAIDKAAGAERDVVGVIPDRWTGKGNAFNFSTDRPQSEVSVTGDPATPEAQQWEGWGTALKPAYEPVSIFTKGSSLTFHAEPKRLYYCAKAPKKERNLGLTPDITNAHPTIKPLKLMEQLCQLATPQGGTILDPFMGSGTTGIAALNMGYNFIGIDMGEEYFDIASLRLNSLFPQDGERA